ncbi:hypothetical protein [Poseidonibacter ostreae]|uniref:Uncharacterized protein n=1 Tax=Poseidonibacter ostreae TaxID=2654171 RepID=A0A6L4WY39_9BACT|nr:hypothetical protein [Poseidonibacter ostreae]KAB7891380.1 hypothetical protein GBG19_00660 [Poseidonibacter ostreae]
MAIKGTKTMKNNFIKIKRPNTLVNNFAWTLKNSLSEKKISFSKFAEFTNEKHDTLVIEYITDDMVSTDFLTLQLKRFKLTDGITFTYMNTTHEEIGEDPKGFLSKRGLLKICNLDKFASL